MARKNRNSPDAIGSLREPLKEGSEKEDAKHPSGTRKAKPTENKKSH